MCIRDRTSVDTPSEALAISIGERGKVDLPFMAQLLGTPEAVSYTHLQIGNNVFHICQFAEIMERNGARYMAEPEIMGDEAAWKVGRDRILAVQICEDGYDYTLFDEHYNEIDGCLLYTSRCV